MNVLVQILALVGTLAMAVVIPGLRPVWLIPAYGILALAAILSWSPKRCAGLSVRVLPCFIATGVFAGYILVRNILSPFDYAARADLFIVLGGLIVYFVTALCATSTTSRLVMGSVLLVLACVQVFIGALQFTKGNDFMPFDCLPRTAYKARASGFYGCPNHLAGFLEVTLPLALGLVFWSRWRLTGRILTGFAALVSIAGLMMSGSRGGYVSAAAGLATFAILSLWISRRWMRPHLWTLLATALVFSTVAGSCAAWFTVRSSDFLTFRVQSAGVDAPVRLGLWRAAIEQFQISPLTGTGGGTYLFYGRKFRSDEVQADPVYAHNDYLQLLAEYGLIGIAGLALFLFVHVRGSWKFTADILAGRTVDAEREEPGFHGDNSLALTIGALSGIVAIAAHSVTDFNLHIPMNTLVMAFLFGSIANPFSVVIPEPRSGGETGRDALRFIPAVLPILGLWLAASSLPRWSAENYADKSKQLLSDWHSLEEPNVAQQAADFARMAIERDPRNPENYLSLGDSSIALAEMADEPAAREPFFRQAIDAYSRGFRVVPLDSNMALALAGAYDSLERYEKSGPLYLRAMELDGNNWEVLWRYGTYLERVGRSEEARPLFKRAFDLFPNLSTGASLQRQKLTPAPTPGQP